MPVCLDCETVLNFVGSWTYRDLWGYTEVHTYECPSHGPIFVSTRKSVADGPDTKLNKRPDHGDGDSLIPVPRKPASPLNADAIAIPEPD